ncbi:MAG: SCO family protein [Leptothrix sp. (in: b-proteobacteria)]
MSGSNSSAPDASLAPEPLSFTVHSLPEPSLETRRTASGRLKMLLVMLICAAPVLASYFTYYVIRPGVRNNYGTLIEPMRSLPAAAALPLQNTDGQPVDPQSLRGQWLLVVVADGACDAACERLLYAQRQLRETLGREKDRVDRVWLVTGDAPVRETLRPAMAQASVLRVPRAALAQWLTPAEGETLEAHLYLVDPMGNWMMRFPAAFDPAKVKRDLERLLRAAASWDLPGR